MKTISILAKKLLALIGIFKGEWVNDLETPEGEFIPALIGEQLAQRTSLKQGDKIKLQLPK